MIELTSPPLRECPFCSSEPEVERGWDYNDLTVCFLRIKCPKCSYCGHWIKFFPDIPTSIQKAIDETSYWWNNHKIYDEDDDEY